MVTLVRVNNGCKNRNQERYPKRDEHTFQRKARSGGRRSWIVLFQHTLDVGRILSRVTPCSNRRWDTLLICAMQQRRLPLCESRNNLEAEHCDETISNNKRTPPNRNAQDSKRPFFLTVRKDDCRNQRRHEQYHLRIQKCTHASTIEVVSLIRQKRAIKCMRQRVGYGSGNRW